MPTRFETDAKALQENRTGDEIVATARLASLAFDGLSLSDDELDELCEAVLFRDAARSKTTDDEQAWRLSMPRKASRDSDR